MASKDTQFMETIVSLCKRRGFVFQASEIYGGIGNTYDYGPLGVELKRRVKDAWWTRMVTLRDDMVGLDSAIIQNPKTWETSGHVAGFTDPMVDCKKCKGRFRADKLADASCPERPSKRPGECGGELTEARAFNLMFKTNVGPVEGAGSVAYLRPETAQGIFLNFKNVLECSRQKPPFGIAQIGKSFRNEITPGNFTFRTREFEQMEIEFFCPPDEAADWHKRWLDDRWAWYTDLGMKPDNIRRRPHNPDELAHYVVGCEDFEYHFPFGWSELEGIANRTNFDLTQHQTLSGKDLTYFDEETKQAYVPYVIEPSAGADRATLAFLIDSYDEETDAKGETRVVLRLHPMLAPYKVAVLPLSKKAELTGPARKLHAYLAQYWSVDYDETQAIGRRYRRQDEIGTPFCITVDFDTLDDQAVTIRERDTMAQERVALTAVKDYLAVRLAGC